MGFFDRIQPGVQARNPAEEFWWTPTVGTTALSGVRVSPDTAPKVSAVYACGALISESLASLPAITYRMLDGGARERDPQHPIYRLLHRRPNPRMTPFQFKHGMQWNVLFRGAAYARFIPGRRGQVDRLQPIHPDLVRREVLADDTLRFLVKDPGSNTEAPILQEDMFWVDGLSVDGVNPVSVISYARESIGLAIAAEEYAARVYSQGGLHKGVLTHPGNLSQSAQERLREQFLERHAGLANAHAPLILEEDMKFAATSMTPEDAVLIESREFSVADIARWFRVPLHMIGQTTKETSWGSGIEQLSQSFVTYTLLPWLIRWEEAITRDLLGEDDPEHFVEFLTNALLRGDQKSRYEAYQVAVGGPFMTRNEVRRLENMNPQGDGLDEVLVPLNMASQSQFEQLPMPTDPPGPRPAPAPAQPTRQSPDRKALVAYVEDAAGRVVRKEQAALTKAARRSGEDPAAWGEAVQGFYADHAPHVAAAMRIPAAAAADYVETQMAELIVGGLPDEGWWAVAIDALVARALEEHQ